MFLICAAHLIWINRRETSRPPGLERAASSRKFSRWQRHQQGAIFTTHRSLYLFICITFSPLPLWCWSSSNFFIARILFWLKREEISDYSHTHTASQSATRSGGERESKKVGIREMILLSITDSAKCTTHAQRRSLSLSLFLLCNTQTPNQNHVEGRGR